MKKDTKQSTTSYAIAVAIVLLGCVLIDDLLIRKLGIPDSKPAAATHPRLDYRHDDNVIKDSAY
jgi:hypothetical protein